MTNLTTIIWLFPILFMIHDFEEIILLKPWTIRNSDYFQNNFPKFYKKFFNHLKILSAESFALGVAEEFVIIVLVVLFANFSNDYKLWLGLFIAFSFHLVIHIIQSIIIKKYVPAIFTTILFLPCCVYIINFIVSNLSINYLILTLYSILGIIIMVGNLIFMHKFMKRFNQWLILYQNKK